MTGYSTTATMARPPRTALKHCKPRPNAEHRRLYALAAVAAAAIARGPFTPRLSLRRRAEGLRLRTMVASSSTPVGQARRPLASPVFQDARRVLLRGGARRTGLLTITGNIGCPGRGLDPDASSFSTNTLV